MKMLECIVSALAKQAAAEDIDWAVGSYVTEEGVQGIEVELVAMQGSNEVRSQGHIPLGELEELTEDGVDEVMDTLLTNLEWTMRKSEKVIPIVDGTLH